MTVALFKYVTRTNLETMASAQRDLGGSREVVRVVKRRIHCEERCLYCLLNYRVVCPDVGRYVAQMPQKADFNIRGWIIKGRGKDELLVRNYCSSMANWDFCAIFLRPAIQRPIKKPLFLIVSYCCCYYCPEIFLPKRSPAHVNNPLNL